MALDVLLVMILMFLIACLTPILFSKDLGPYLMPLGSMNDA